MWAQGSYVGLDLRAPVFVPGASQHACARARVTCCESKDFKWKKKKAIQGAKKAGEKRDKKLFFKSLDAEIEQAAAQAAARIVAAITGSADIIEGDANSSDSYY
jgi:hypothetical protein